MDDGGVVDFIHEVLVVKERVESADGFGDAVGKLGVRDVHVPRDGDSDYARPDGDYKEHRVLGLFGQGEHGVQDLRDIKEVAADRGEYGKRGERSPHGDWRFVGMTVAAIFAEERHEESAEDVEGGHARGYRAEPEHPGRVMIGGDEDGVFAPEAGERRNASNGEGGDQESPEGDGRVFFDPTHVTHILLAVTGVNDAAGAQEEQGFEERVRHQMPDSGGECSDSDAEEHVPKLRNGGVRENLFDIVLDQADSGGEDGRREADQSDRFHRYRRVREDRGGTCTHVDARCDHGRRMDEGGNGPGTFHGVRQPDIERNLRGFTRGAEEHQQRDGSERVNRLAGRGFEDLAEIQAAEVDDYEEHREREAEVADTVDDECFVAGVSGALLQKVEADEQVAAQTHSFPPDEQQKVVRRKHQVQHEKHEEVEVREEAVIAFFMLHVAGGVNVDERADAGDEHQHDHRQLVDHVIPADIKRADADPGEVADVDGFRAPIGIEPHHDDQEERQDDAADSDNVRDHLREPATEEAVDQKADKWKCRY